MIKATTGGFAETNVYNGDGLRVSKTDEDLTGGSTAETSYFAYVYSDVVLELNGSGAQVAYNVVGTNIISRYVGTLWGHTFKKMIIKYFIKR